MPTKLYNVSGQVVGLHANYSGPMGMTIFLFSDLYAHF